MAENSYSLNVNEETTGRQMLNKVPQVTIFFWIIKVLCTTVGETASDFLNVNLGFGLTGTSIVSGILLAFLLFFQFRAKKYMPGIYWMTVVLISIFGTLVTDNLTDAMNVPLEISTVVFSIALAITFIIWYANEKTLSIHSIHTTRREAFYWLAILFTFALGTASGDLMSESLGLGYLMTGVIVIAVVVSVSIAWRLGLDSVLSFWVVYIMTRPLGASVGDFLTQPHKYGGLGLGATITTVIFIAAILLTVVFLAVTKLDVKAKESGKEAIETKHHAVLPQVVAVVCVLVLSAGAGYYWQHTKLMAEVNASAEQALPQAVTSSSGLQVSSQPGTSSSGSQTSSQVSTSSSGSQTSKLGDLSSFIKIEEDTLNLVNSGDLSGAKSRVDDLEYSWDQAEATLKPKDTAKWNGIDKTIDTVLRQLRAVNPDATACKSALEASLAAMK